MTTVNRFLPLALRRLSTLRPPGVSIRAKKPWVLFRFRLLGWYVRFISAPSFLSALFQAYTGGLVNLRERACLRPAAGPHRQVADMEARTVTLLPLSGSYRPRAALVQQPPNHGRNTGYWPRDWGSEPPARNCDGVVSRSRFLGVHRRHRCRHGRRRETCRQAIA